MRVLIDTNVLVDVLCKREKFYQASADVLKLCEVGLIDGYISALTIPNIVYIMRKELDAKMVKQLLDRILLIVEVVDFRVEDLRKAAVQDFEDYEDAVQSISARRIKADYIVTRNVKDFANSVIEAVAPNEMITLFKGRFYDKQG